MDLLTLTLVAAVGLAPVAAADPAPVGRVLFTVSDPRIDEASGLSVATREPGVWFMHNDSGDSARFFAVGPRGRTLATYVVDGAHNVDWEDMAAAPSPAHVPTLWFADIGDNRHSRSSVDVYAVPEPGVFPALRAAAVHVHSVRYRLRYPDGAHDAETLLVDPRTSRIYVATKSFDGTTGVYAAPARPSSSATSRLTLIATLHWTGQHPVTSLADLAAQLSTTGGAFSTDGRTVALRTYTDVYLWSVGSGTGGLARALRAEPRRLTLPRQPQGESVCFRRDGKALLVGSERVSSDVLEVLLPHQVAASTPAATQPAVTAVAASRPMTTPSAQSSAESLAVRAKSPRRSRLPVVAAGVAAVLVVGALVVRRRRDGSARSSR